MSVIAGVIDDANQPPRIPTSVFNIELRRAVLGIMLLTRSPMTLAELEAALLAIGVITRPGLVRTANRVLSDVLSYQVRLGRVRRIKRGVYQVIPESMNATMRWRCQRVVRLRCAER